MAKTLSRPKRWAAACADAREALEKLNDALMELDGIRQEYEEWGSNLPDNLQSGALADKINTIVEIQFDGAADEVESALDEAESADLPLGFGRD